MSLDFLECWLPSGKIEGGGMEGENQAAACGLISTARVSHGNLSPTVVLCRRSQQKLVVS